MTETMTAAAYQTSMTEVAMEQAIRQLIGSRGFVFHINDSRRTPEMQHFPDLVLVLPDKQMVVFAELKSQRRKLTAGQADVLAGIDACMEVVAVVVRPRPDPGEISFDTLVSWLAS